MTVTIGKDVLKQLLPKGVGEAVLDNLIRMFDSGAESDEMKEIFKENLISYTGVVKDSRFKAEDYFRAVKYVTAKLLGKTNTDGYVIAHPDRYQAMVAKGYGADEIQKFVSAYSRNKLVILILEQSLVPFHIFNNEMYQKALNTQADLMVHANSEKVRSDAANSILTHLKPPETHKIALEVGVKENDGLRVLNSTMEQLVLQQKKMLKLGVVDVKEVAQQKLLHVIEGAVE